MFIPRKLQRNKVLKVFFCVEIPIIILDKALLQQKKYKIRNAENMYADALHACELRQGAFSQMGGRYYEDEVYNVDEKCAKEFDM